MRDQDERGLWSIQKLPHLNFIGDSPSWESHIHFEAGAIAANYFNEKQRRKKSLSGMENTVIWHKA
jgi:hypothetical protein